MNKWPFYPLGVSLRLKCKFALFVNGTGSVSDEESCALKFWMMEERIGKIPRLDRLHGIVKSKCIYDN